MRHLATFLAFPLLFGSGVTLPAADSVYGTISGWGQMVDPDGDCHFNVEQHAVTIGFSGAIQGLDVESGRMNAPRVVQSLRGDFSVQVTVDGNLPLPDDEEVTAYVRGSLVMHQDDRSYLRLERTSVTRAGELDHYANFGQRIGGPENQKILSDDCPLQNDKPVDLRFEVKAGTVRALVRHTGQKWHEMGIAKVDASATFLVGVSGVNTSQQPVEVTFRQFQVGQTAVEAETAPSSELNLSPPPKIAKLPSDANLPTHRFYSGLIVLQRRFKGIDEMDNDARQELIDLAKKLFVENGGGVFERLAPRLVAGLSRAFQKAADEDHAIAVYDQFIDVLKGSDDDGLKNVVKQLEAARDDAKFKRDLIDKPLSLEGKILSDDDFDQSRHQGNVVLVDFWAP